MYGFHFDHHTLSIARDGELLAHEPLAVETAARDPRFGLLRAGGARAADEVSLGHWRELGRSETAARTCSEVPAHCVRSAVKQKHRGVGLCSRRSRRFRVTVGAVAMSSAASTRATSSIRDTTAARWSIAVTSGADPSVAPESRSRAGGRMHLRDAFVSEVPTCLDATICAHLVAATGQEHALRSVADSSM